MDQQNQLDNKQHNTLVEYRLDELQRTLTTLNTVVAGISAQLTTLQLSLPDRFLTRLEFNESQHQRELLQDQISERLGKIEMKQDRLAADLVTMNDTWHNRSFSLIGTIALAGVSLVVGLINAAASILHVTPH